VQFIQSLMERLQGRAGAATVYGEPIVAEGKTVIPCAKLAFGFGGGSGVMRAGDGDLDQTGREGAGGGGGIAAKPVGVVEITATGTRFIRFEDTRTVAGALVAGLLVGFLIGRRWSRS
jgi:uncharacterized spore protein YtfJ